ncbi:MAG: TonB-dependent receptor [Bacteroidetes Order II. Incertae sedis bacterium]|jgi:outer membrane receptor protein involved in Fe transport|nr:TonB-dependent receptor [Bacteroidetes Order II. bacterium]MBT4603839.1 TonB-dependent receptor [Bacteroidetes Order II. bacterium]MBT5248697.1 TonB-dependent receptor [Bacteroidetes Order II. bacterium]MBT6201637.1 TonB-dependent receptor [Bacteroidetes Order II. bacterium]MBT6425473.1 TonB-dependent receptor [Bacteroidetes Order II. bacterium]
MIFRKSHILFFLLLLLGSDYAAAQGILAGTVRDAETGESLPGVNLIVVGTSRGAASDPNGRYEIPNLRAGEYSVRVSFIGFETKLFTEIVITDGSTTQLDVELGVAVLSTEDEIVVVGERPLVNVESSSSSSTISQEQLELAPLRDVQQAVATQVGVVRDPTGLYIRGGRASETGFYVDGVSAKDPLAGTGFGLDVGSNSFSEIEVITGGIGAEFGDVTSGVVAVQTQDGTDQFKGFFSHKRDNFGFNKDAESNFMEDIWEANLSGPIIPGKLRFFFSGQVQLSDGFTRNTATPDQVRTSMVDGTFFLPRTGNRWNGISKLTWAIRPGMKLQGSYQRSLTVNQNTRMLQVTGNEAVISPGFQYAFVLQPDNASTFAHDNIISYLKWSHVINDQSFYDVQFSRLFTRLRADANGRRWRPDNVDTELDPFSIVSWPANLFVDENGLPLDPNAQFVLPGPGLFNNGGIATRFHDHFAEEYTLRATYTRFSSDLNNRLSLGFEAKVNDYQWIDVIRPWVGAPIGTGESAGTNRLGDSSDIWRVKPRRGALFGTHQIRYRGLIANAGLRFEYWAPGKYVDDLIEDPQAPILDTIRESYKSESVKLFGMRTKFRLLPKLRVSFPITENRVMFFNYGHSTKLPHPTFVYTGLDPFFQDRSFFSDLGNPNLDPEVDISYELGLRTQFTSNDVLNVTAFWRDKFDFITVQSVIVPDPTGREVLRAFRVNGDFARVRGIEASYLKRVGERFSGQISASFSRATGLSSTNNDALSEFLANGDIDNTFETPLAWDRPFDFKGNITFQHDRDRPLFGIKGLNRISALLSTTLRSGQRYTPVEFQGNEINPFSGEQDWRPIYSSVSDPAARYSEIGATWWWFDLSMHKTVSIQGTDVRLSLEVANLFNQQNSIIVNPVTGEAYPNVDPQSTDFISLRDNAGYDVPSGTRDPRFEDPNTSGLPPFNPARFLPQRHFLFGVSFRF